MSILTDHLVSDTWFTVQDLTRKPWSVHPDCSPLKSPTMRFRRSLSYLTSIYSHGITSDWSLISHSCPLSISRHGVYPISFDYLFLYPVLPFFWPSWPKKDIKKMRGKKDCNDSTILYLHFLRRLAIHTSLQSWCFIVPFFALKWCWLLGLLTNPPFLNPQLW